MPVKNQVELITYPDSLGGNLAMLDRVLQQGFRGLFGGVHVLPPYISSGDRGFSPVDYAQIEPAFGSWDDIRRIAEHTDVLVDLMVNHISRRSPYFQDFLRQGRRSPYADLFITLDKIWPDGEPPQADVAKIFLRKPDHPFSTVTIEATGHTERIWTTFGKRDWSEQVDLDVNSPATRKLLTGYLRFFAQHGVRIVRLDAIGYVIKKPGTSCFMVEPEIYAFIDWLVGVACQLGLELLPEVHAHHSVQRRLADHGYWVYDFVLPLLTLHTLLEASGSKLRSYLKGCPRRQFTMLDCHDGIPVLPDVEGILTTSEAKRIVDHCVGRGANLSRILSAHKAEGGFDAHQINCTYYSALGSDDAYLAARAIQLFAPGIPQVYYVGLLAGRNDEEAVRVSGEGRAINRHNYSLEEIERALEQPIVGRLLRLIRLRNTHPAFSGEFHVLDSAEGQVRLAWRQGEASCQVDVDLARPQTTVLYSGEGGQMVRLEV